MKRTKSLFMVSLIAAAVVTLITSSFKQSVLNVHAQTASPPAETAFAHINFSSLGAPISALGPVSPNEADTAELQSIRAQFGEAWKKIRPRSIVPEQQIARADLVREEADALYQFTIKYPSSFWTPPIQSRLGYYYRTHGGYSRALEMFAASWEATKSFDIPEVKQVADASLAQYIALLTRLGRVETLATIFEETAERRLPYGSDADAYLTGREAYSHMKFAPGTSYRCGTYALANAANVAFETKRYLLDVKPFNSPEAGFSVQGLREISDQLNLGFIPVFWNDNPAIVVPSVVHWKANHYAAITAKHGSWYTVIDPTFDSAPALLHEKDILAEASGVFMVPADKIPAGWTQLRPEEQAQVIGRGYFTFARTTLTSPPAQTAAVRAAGAAVWVLAWARVAQPSLQADVHPAACPLGGFPSLTQAFG